MNFLIFRNFFGIFLEFNSIYFELNWIKIFFFIAWWCGINKNSSTTWRSTRPPRVACVYICACLRVRMCARVRVCACAHICAHMWIRGKHPVEDLSWLFIYAMLIDACLLLIFRHVGLFVFVFMRRWRGEMRRVRSSVKLKTYRILKCLNLGRLSNEL